MKTPVVYVKTALIITLPAVAAVVVVLSVATVVVLGVVGSVVVVISSQMHFFSHVQSLTSNLSMITLVSLLEVSLLVEDVVFVAVGSKKMLKIRTSCY